MSDEAFVHIVEQVGSYYGGKLREHGITPRGVDWNSVESQTMRFDQLLKVCDTDAPFTLTDFGCGYGALFDHLAARHTAFTYTGFDVSKEMTTAARELHADDPRCRFVEDRDAVPASDYCVASGVLNVKMTIPSAEWERYVLAVIESLNALGRRGFAFNALTKYSDADRMRDDLHYADPHALFDHCRRYSRQVALLHDYPLYEFSIIVRKPEG